MIGTYLNYTINVSLMVDDKDIFELHNKRFIDGMIIFMVQNKRYG